jgi:hypothetical protein
MVLTLTFVKLTGLKKIQYELKIIYSWYLCFLIPIIWGQNLHLKISTAQL